MASWTPGSLDVQSYTISVGYISVLFFTCFSDQPRVRKKFIDKKNAITYQLIHRSQKDPLQADEDASKMVLVTGDEVGVQLCKCRLMYK